MADFLLNEKYSCITYLDYEKGERKEKCRIFFERDGIKKERKSCGGKREKEMEEEIERVG